MIFDTVMFNDELDMLECRLTEFDELGRANTEPVTHVVIESPVTHRDEPKPLHCRANWARFEKWHDYLLPVIASKLPTATEDSNPWSREHAQREYAGKALKTLHAKPSDIVLHGDVDEIPRMEKLAEACRLARENRTVVLEMRLHSYAVDWYAAGYPWNGTVVTMMRNLPSSFTQLRDLRNTAQKVANAGWHLTWLGDNEATQRKLKTHCHLEMTPEEEYWPASGESYRTGRTHGGIQQVPVDDLTDYPRYIRNRQCPPSWFRPREDEA